MNDYNDPNFLLADSDPLKHKAEIERSKKNIKDTLAVAAVLLIIWGCAVAVVLSQLNG